MSGLPERPDRFVDAARRVLHDAGLRRAYDHVTTRFIDHRTVALADADDALIDHAAAVRQRSIAALPDLLARFGSVLAANGGTVHHAATAAQACAAVGAICRAHGARRVVKSKSMTSEEIGLNASLEMDGVEVVETDLGERIIQLAGEQPAHIIAPSIEFDRHRVTALFQQHLGLPATTDIAALTRQARESLREAFRTADVGITGANFLVAETGSMQRTLMRGSTGQPFTSYFQLISGPVGDTRELHVVLLDNGRRTIHDDAPFADALRCIRCSSCLNVCPVYRRAGARAYGAVYPGPIGTVLTSLADPARMAELAEACSVCGHCTAICPVGIDLEQMHLDLRARVRSNGDEVTPPAHRPPGSGTVVWSTAFRVFSAFATRPRWWDRALRMVGWVARWFTRCGWLRRSPVAWTRARDLPAPARESFQHWWWREGERRFGMPEATPSPPAASAPEAPTVSPAASPPPLDRFHTGFERAGGVRVADVAAGLDQAAPGAVLINVPDDMSDTVATAVRTAGRQVLFPADIDTDTLFADVAVGINVPTLAIADTGTLVEWRDDRTVSLVPPVHMALFDPAVLLPDIASALARLPQPLPPAVTFVTGPSRTADIEQTLTVGVHGPLQVVLAPVPPTPT